MSSQDSSVQLMEKLCDLRQEEIQDNLDEILPKLISCLSGDDKGHVMQSVHAMLVTCLPCVPLKIADSCLLRYAMPAAHQLLNESLEGIQLRLEEMNLTQEDDVTDTLTSLLQVCMEVLKCVEGVLSYIASQGNVTASDVPSVPKVVASLLLQTFQHCKESEMLYGEIFPTLADVLNAVFRQCHQVQCCFFKVLTTNIHFNCTLEHDVVLLIEVMQILSQIGEHIMKLDLKTMAEQWKGFARLIQQYLEPLRQRLDIAQTVQFLCLEVECGLEQVMKFANPLDTKAMGRILKTTTFVLKIVVKLCEQFGGGGCWLGECHSHLLKLLLVLHSYSPPCLRLRDIDNGLVDEIERHIIVAADPLLSHLICEEPFRQEYFAHQELSQKKSREHLAWLLLTLALIRRLIGLDPEKRACWLSCDSKKNILGVLLTYLRSCHRVLSEQVYIPSVVRSGEQQRMGDLYEALTSHSAGLLLCSSDSQFSVLESLLLDSLLEPYVWPALLASDVWCICARAGTSDLCLEQVLYLSELLISMRSAGIMGRPELSNVSLLLRRLCSFLGNRGKQVLIEYYPPSKFPHMWQVFGLTCLPDSMRDSASNAVTAHSVSSVENFLSNMQSVDAFNEMLSTLSAVPAVLETSSVSASSNQCVGLVSGIFSLWQHIIADEQQICYVLSSTEKRVAGCDWLPQLLKLLCSCTQYLVHFMTNPQILDVLVKLQSLIFKSSSSIKLSALRVLRGLGKIFLTPTAEQSRICGLISSIFAGLLQDTNPLVMQSALQTFEYFAHITRHESIVANTVCGNEHLQQLVTAYIQKDSPKVCSSAPTVSFGEYLTAQSAVSFTHLCVRPERPERPDLSDQAGQAGHPAKKLCLDLDNSDVFGDLLGDDLMNCLEEKGVTEAISRINKDSQFLVTYCALNKLPETAKRDLQKAVTELNNLL